MINVIVLPLLFLLWLTSGYFNPGLNFQLSGNPITYSNSSIFTNPVVKTSSGIVRGITKTMMAAKVDVYLGVITSSNYYALYLSTIA